MMGNPRGPGGGLQLESWPFDFFRNLNTARTKRRKARRRGVWCCMIMRRDGNIW